MKTFIQDKAGNFHNLLKADGLSVIEKSGHYWIVLLMPAKEVLIQGFTDEAEAKEALRNKMWGIYT